jgi:Skp family chaperone for outer membrane proteins
LKSTITKSLLLALVAAIVAPHAAESVTAQETKNAGLVAVLDVAKVFKENQDFEAKMQTIKAEADNLKVQITQQQEEIKAEAQGLAAYTVGSPDRNRLEEQLEQKQTKLRTKARQAETELLNREAKIYFDTYQEMQAVVSSIANQHGISLVLRFDSDEIDPMNRPEVIKGVNRAVVFHRRLDLTNLVIKQMNPAQAQAPTGTQGR